MQVEKRTSKGIVFAPVITILTVSLLVYDIANTISVNGHVLHTVLHVKLFRSMHKRDVSDCYLLTTLRTFTQ